MLLVGNGANIANGLGLLWLLEHALPALAALWPAGEPLPELVIVGGEWGLEPARAGGGAGGGGRGARARADTATGAEVETEAEEGDADADAKAHSEELTQTLRAVAAAAEAAAAGGGGGGGGGGDSLVTAYSLRLRLRAALAHARRWGLRLRQTGRLSEPRLRVLLQRGGPWVFLSPATVGSGVCTKNILAMEAGIALVTTPDGARGLSLPTPTPTSSPGPAGGGRGRVRGGARGGAGEAVAPERAPALLPCELLARRTAAAAATTTTTEAAPATGGEPDRTGAVAEPRGAGLAGSSGVEGGRAPPALVRSSPLGFAAAAAAALRRPLLRCAVGRSGSAHARALFGGEELGSGADGSAGGGRGDDADASHWGGEGLVEGGRCDCCDVAAVRADAAQGRQGQGSAPGSRPPLDPATGRQTQLNDIARLLAWATRDKPREEQ
jgi:hypothetical protein